MVNNGADGDRTIDPIIVLTYPHANDDLLYQILSAVPSLTCTQRTGMMPLCQNAVRAWQSIENREGTPSPLALTSVRSLVSTMTTVLRAQTGATRWCETANAGRMAAAAFLQVFPKASFLCLYRSLPLVISETTRAYPWGLGGGPLWPYSAGHPGSNLAAIVAYWTATTKQLVDFEGEYPQCCLRVRHEDLAAQPYPLAAEILARLRLNAVGPAASGLPDGGLSVRADRDQASVTAASAELHPPWEQVPSHLLSEAAELHERLGYGSMHAQAPV